MISNPEFQKALDGLLKNESIRHHVLDPIPNFWDIVAYSSVSSDGRSVNYETEYTKMLRWLLDPRASHQLGTLFADAFLALVASRISEQHKTHLPSPLPKFDTLKTKAIAEKKQKTQTKKGGPDRPDIQVFDNQTALIIENKINTDDNERQLDSYYKNASTDKPGRKKYYFAFLTPGQLNNDGELIRLPDGAIQPREPKNSTHKNAYAWITYYDLEPLLERAISHAVFRNDRHTVKIIEDFYFDQRRILAYPLDPKLEDLTREFPDQIKILAKYYGIIEDPFSVVVGDSSKLLNELKTMPELENLSIPQWSNLVKILWDTTLLGQRYLVEQIYRQLKQNNYANVKVSGTQGKSGGTSLHFAKAWDDPACNKHALNDNHHWLHINGGQLQKWPNASYHTGNPKLTFEPDLAPSEWWGDMKTNYEYLKGFINSVADSINNDPCGCYVNRIS